MSALPDLSVAPRAIQVPQHGLTSRLRAAGQAFFWQVAGSLQATAAGLKRARTWREDAPQQVGLDRLAEQGFQSWIPRG